MGRGGGGGGLRGGQYGEGKGAYTRELPATHSNTGGKCYRNVPGDGWGGGGWGGWVGGGGWAVLGGVRGGKGGVDGLGGGG